jgi:hypothetical protein
MEPLFQKWPKKAGEKLENLEKITAFDIPTPVQILGPMGYD